MANAISKLLGVENGKGLKCDFSYLRSKLDYLLNIGAEVYRLKARERFLTMDEKKQLALLEEDMELHIKDLYEKCGVFIPKEKILRAFEEDPDLLKIIASSLTEFKVPAEGSQSTQK